MIVPDTIGWREPPGEKLIFKRIGQEGDCDEWTIFHSLNIAEHIRNPEGEIDFLFVIPRSGIVVVEVKSHEEISYKYPGGWKLGKDRKNPFKQVKEAKYSLINFLKERKLNYNLPVVSCVWFTHANVDVTSSEWNKWELLDNRNLDYSIKRNILNVLKNETAHLSAKGLNFNYDTILPEEHFNEICHSLRPKIDYICETSYFPETHDLLLNRATEEQFGVLNSLSGNDRILINGLAGTGKTSLAVEIARRRLEENANSIIAIFCYNKFFGNHLEKTTKSYGIKCKSGRFYKWLYDFLRKLRFLSDTDLKTNLSVELTLTKRGLQYFKKNHIKGTLDYLIIDEAQDLLNRDNLMIFDYLLKGGLSRGKWFIAGDFEFQNIFHNTLDLKEFFRGECINFTDYTLTTNCRNTPETGRFIRKILGLQSLYTNYLRPASNICPKFVTYQVSNQQEEVLDKILKEVATNGYNTEQIIILSPVKKELSFVSKLSDSFINTHNINDYSDAQKGIRFCTIQAFKGLESPVIIIVDFNLKNEKYFKDLTYIGLSRSTSVSYIISEDKIVQKIKAINDSN